MPRKIGALVCLALAIIAGCVWVLGLGQVPGSPLPARAGAGEEKYSLTAEFPEVRGSYTLYRVVPVIVTEERVREVAERFGLAGEPGAMNKKTGEFLLIDASKDPEEQVSVYAHSGAVAYHILDLELPTEVTRQPDLPTDAEAEKIALAFLEKTGMQSPDARVVEVGVNQKQEVWKAGESEPEASYDVTKAVRFGRSLDGLPVYGDEFAVILGDGGKVVGLVKTWREVTPDGNVGLRSPGEAYEDLRLQQGLSALTWVGSMIRSRSRTSRSVTGWSREVSSRIWSGRCMRFPEPRSGAALRSRMSSMSLPMRAIP
jgi:hypothetical protein